MKKLLLFLLIAFANNYFAQIVFCPPGAEWRHQFTNGINSDQLGKFVYTHDTSIAGESAKVLNYRWFFKKASGWQCNTMAIKQKGDTIFMRNCNTGHSWQILYNFAALATQSWTNNIADSGYFAGGLTPTTVVTVKNVSTVTINGMPLKKLDVEYCYVFPTGQSCRSTSIIERIGCLEYLTNYFNLPGGSDYYSMTEFLCYKDNGIGTVEYSTKGCDYPVGIERNYNGVKAIQISPNPASQDLLITSNLFQANEPATITIFNQLGQLILKEEQLVEAGRVSINVTQLQPGIYVSTIKFKGTETSLQKFVVVR